MNSEDATSTSATAAAGSVAVAVAVAVAVLGAGIMGSAIACRLLACGHSVAVFNLETAVDRLHPLVRPHEH